MNSKDFIGHIEYNTQKLIQKYSLIGQTLKNRDKDPTAWENACKDFQETFDQLAFPGGLAKELELLKSGNSDAISLAIIYLHADPYFYRSGYIKQKLIRLLKKHPLLNEQRTQLQQVVLKAVQENTRREFIEYCRLARSIQDEAFIQNVESIYANTDDNRIKERAQQMLQAINKK